jgi:hypothetical protein
VIAVLLVALAAASSADVPQTWTTRRPIAVPAIGVRAFVEAPLDAAVYAVAESSLADLRVRERGGPDVAYVVRQLDGQMASAERDVPLLDLVVTPSKQTRFVLDLGPRPGSHGAVRVRVADGAGSFRVPVRVETSDDGKTWDVARAAGFIYDVAGQTRAVDTSVTYPRSRARWLRVTLEPFGGAPLPVRGAAVCSYEAVAEREEDVVGATIVERDRDGTRKVSQLVLDIGGRRPLDRVELDVTDRNFYRVVTVDVSDDRRLWRSAGSAAVSALDAPRHPERETRVRLPETSVRYLRLTIHDQDDRPLEITGARVAGARRTLVFEAIAGREYVLDYGNPRATAPRYDIERTVRSLDLTRLPRAALGAAVPVPPPPPRVRPPWLDAQPVVMWTAMAVAVVALGALLVRLLRGAAGDSART